MASALEDGKPLNDWRVFDIAGAVVSGFIGAATSGRPGAPASLA
jgi:hypothetical protein